MEERVLRAEVNLAIEHGREDGRVEQRLELPVLRVAKDLRDPGDRDAVVDRHPHRVLLDGEHAAEPAIGDQESAALAGGCCSRSRPASAPASAALVARPADTALVPALMAFLAFPAAEWLLRRTEKEAGEGYRRGRAQQYDASELVAGGRGTASHCHRPTRGMANRAVGQPDYFPSRAGHNSADNSAAHRRV
jgi:hypothetical protein